ncbi:GntR family transcriptional regulator [Lederbergia lenta]|uniref:GntR family transcriptional regulator n=1 Tax=Lederbergia lenta TaxID=1467 RepID=A0A2X4W8R1_LEDLE|nr:GntR family transcriptional regulator [Lederbergia lenta]MCM3110943.1 GntR family transcriptional regulator [Lederbergia lenta]MEC2325661.1 GntR family transcriptional regulator [Lederbergia lenta]SQI54030.1 GntR family transcriptional regulator [Lederbergia lenta]
MAKDFEASKPIYIQIADKIIQQIVREEVKPGDKLPSVREMAIQSGVNPNTIQRTYTEMERMGVVETKRGQGTFVVERAEIVMEMKQSMQREIIGQFVNSMTELGISKEQMVVGLDEFLREGDRS